MRPLKANKFTGLAPAGRQGTGLTTTQCETVHNLVPAERNSDITL